VLRRPSAALSALITKLAKEQPADAGWPIEQGRDRGALVIHASAAYVYYLTPEGNVLALDIDDFQQRVDEVTNVGRAINAVAQGAREEPALAELLPERPTNARPCPHCKGTGDEHITACVCNGLGWLT